MARSKKKRDAPARLPEMARMWNEAHLTGLHEGMRFVVEMMGQGLPASAIVGRCRARFGDGAQEEIVSYWRGKCGEISIVDAGKPG